MKLIEFLSLTRTEFPSGLNYITQDKTGYIYASIDKPVLSGDTWLSKRDVQKVGHAELCEDWSETVVSRKDVFLFL
ncbi:Uncharacterised protein [Yersinia frederiksenii]|uniref:hypothetical protein n=1 Tax=Yersinia frederiksenii TaxID=29484 RepID=UPI0005DD343D|nr:hypothetical protein [Yersinia frederiksenii]CND05440.1 Uncharacterised protein [Yersinia frederiksenii]